MWTDGLRIINKLKNERYKEAKTIFWSGSISKGKGTSTSDLDLLIIYEKLPCTCREAFIYQKWPIDVFIHTVETINSFFQEVGRLFYLPALPRMLAEGIEVPKTTTFGNHFKEIAENFVKNGPILTSIEIDQKRFDLTDLLDDLLDPKTDHQQLAIGTEIYKQVIELYLLTNQKWIDRGKALVRLLEEANPLLEKDLFEAFHELNVYNKKEKVIQIVQDVLAPYGGTLWEGFKLWAPYN